jgi:hypothetical protein
MILIDECVSHWLQEFLENNGIKERIVCVSQNEGLKGLSDEALDLYAKIAEAYSHKPSILITQDYAFFNDYRGLKVWYKHDEWHRMLKRLKRLLKNY